LSSVSDRIGATRSANRVVSLLMEGALSTKPPVTLKRRVKARI